MEQWSAVTAILQHFSRIAFLHESLFLGVAGELCAAIDVELLIDVVEMDLDRSLADEEFLADLHIAQPGRHLFDNFDFSGRQHLSRLVSCDLAHRG